MTTITWRVGEARTLYLQPRQDDGSVPDLTGVSARLEISAGLACHRVDLIPRAGGFDLRLDDTTLSGLRPRAYPAALVLTWPDGTAEAQRGIVLHIEKGC